MPLPDPALLPRTAHTSESANQLARGLAAGLAQAALATGLVSQGVPPVDAMTWTVSAPVWLAYARAWLRTHPGVPARSLE